MKKYVNQLVQTLRNGISLVFDDGLQSQSLAEVFANRNRAYGAYALRTAYPTHLRNALLYSFGGLFCLFGLLSIDLRKEDTAPVKDQNPIPEWSPQQKIQIIPEPKPQLAGMSKPKVATTGFKPPIVVPDQGLTKTAEPPALATLLQAGTAIGSQTTPGEPATGEPIPIEPTGHSAGTGISTVPVPQEPEIHDVPEVAAQFAEGEKALLLWLSAHIKYPAPAVEAGIEGRVYVQFVVETDGSVTQIKLMRDIGGGCGREALRVVQLMPKWTPARQGGQAVRSRFTVPVLFKLAG